ncbi:hypothetical protein LZ318_19210 [Saccharopolyspora indica]|uniref:hypothetical protein n=1 Tax=Saccharopolyspora indica TaxID=1229659 RepID=UPI0022EAB0D5|nr:hypothetical protein [Saccharopolyspora indica]MDA3643156.1 hypothetical protein [Saccharopolyspora indica]
MGDERRLRRLVVDGDTWHWIVRQQVRPSYPDCRLLLTFFTPEGHRGGARRRLTLVFAPAPDKIISNSHFESGTVLRLPGREHLNLHEPGVARRLLDASAPVLQQRPGERTVELDGWQYFTEAVG